MKHLNNQQPTTEQRTASAIMQKRELVTVAGRSFLCGKITLGDLIELSAVVSELPDVNTKTENVVLETLRIAKDSTPLAEIVAILIRGTRGYRSWLPLRRVLAHMRVSRTAKWLMEHADNEELRTVSIQRLAQTKAGDFFGLIAFLSEVNLTKATTTVSGQQSEPSPSGTE